jgi:hypothetical protein
MSGGRQVSLPEASRVVPSQVFNVKYTLFVMSGGSRQLSLPEASQLEQSQSLMVKYTLLGNVRW